MTHIEFNCSDEKAVALIRASRLYDEGVMPAEWISVKDRLPEPEVDVLCFLGNSISKAVVVAFLRDEEWYFDGWNCPTITHWMPLPEPPEEG